MRHILSTHTEFTPQCGYIVSKKKIVSNGDTFMKNEETEDVCVGEERECCLCKREKVFLLS